MICGVAGVRAGIGCGVRATVVDLANRNVEGMTCSERIDVGVSVKCCGLYIAAIPKVTAPARCSQVPTLNLTGRRIEEPTSDVGPGQRTSAVVLRGPNLRVVCNAEV